MDNPERVSKSSRCQNIKSRKGYYRPVSRNSKISRVNCHGNGNAWYTLINTKGLRILAEKPLLKTRKSKRGECSKKQGRQLHPQLQWAARAPTAVTGSMRGLGGKPHLSVLAMACLCLLPLSLPSSLVQSHLLKVTCSFLLSHPTILFLHVWHSAIHRQKYLPRTWENGSVRNDGSLALQAWRTAFRSVEHRKPKDGCGHAHLSSLYWEAENRWAPWNLLADLLFYLAKARTVRDPVSKKNASFTPTHGGKKITE